MVGWENLPKEYKKEHFLLEIIDSILEESISIRISIEAKTHQDLMYLPSRELTYLLPRTVLKMIFLFRRWDMDSFPGGYKLGALKSTGGV